MNCGTAIVITTSFLDQCKKRQRKEKFRGFIPVHLARYKIQTNEQKCLLGFNWEYLR